MTWRQDAADAAWKKFYNVEMNQRRDLMPFNYLWPDDCEDFQNSALDERLGIRHEEVQDWAILFQDDPPCDDTECACWQHQLFEVAELLYQASWFELNNNIEEANFLREKAQIVDEYGEASLQWWMRHNYEGYAEMVDEINEIGDSATA
jgi:hypothetical protein